MTRARDLADKAIGQRADQWYLNADHTGDATITAWAQGSSSAGGGSIGTGLTESSGVFTFPSTGIWNIKSVFYLNAQPSDGDWMFIGLQTSNDNFSSTNASNVAGAHMVEDEGWQGQIRHDFLFDVTNTSNDKVRFASSSFSSSNKIVGGTSGAMYTWVNFIRLGDT
tara:strand:- start:671 stop:1171 length:501 start_codon:yes stop_codon:yes gene_type:complete